MFEIKKEMKGLQEMKQLPKSYQARPVYNKIKLTFSNKSAKTHTQNARYVGMDTFFPA